VLMLNTNGNKIFYGKGGKSWSSFFFCIKKTRALNYALAFVESYWQAS
jgi:hypothetical protein